jgi:hypothetical protein
MICNAPEVSKFEVYYSIDASEMIGNAPEGFELRLVISQAQLVHLQLAVSSPRSMVSSDFYFYLGGGEKNQ